MSITIAVNFWFLVSMCLIFTLIGIFFGARSAGRGDKQLIQEKAALACQLRKHNTHASQHQEARIESIPS